MSILTRSELEALLRDIDGAEFGDRQPVVEEILQAAIFYEQLAEAGQEIDRVDAEKWRAYVKQNRDAQARYREKVRNAKRKLEPAP